MNFDNFDGIDIVDKISLLRNCKSAERNIMISPYNAIANSRAALEILCKGLIKKNNVEQIKPQPKICKNCNIEKMEMILYMQIRGHRNCM